MYSLTSEYDQIFVVTHGELVRLGNVNVMQRLQPAHSLREVDMDSVKNQLTERSSLGEIIEQYMRETATQIDNKAENGCSNNICSCVHGPKSDPVANL